VLPPHLRRRRNLLLAPEWKQLQEHIADQWIRKTLSRFFHFCSEAGIGPESVGEETLVAFAGYLDVVRLKNPAGLLRETRRAWNRTCESAAAVSGWPGGGGTPLPAKPRADAYSRPLERLSAQPAR
jgi:hypothetical protein